MINSWKKQCPKCNKDQFYCNKNALKDAVENNKLCRSCAQTGKKCSDETKRKLSELFKGKIFSDETKRKISESLTGEKHNRFGIKLSIQDKLKLSNIKMGVKLSEDHKRKIRIGHCERFQRLGIGARQDKGADEFFSKMNSDGYNFQQNWYCKELGYYADGYDKEKHIWCEYDTPYHKKIGQKEKDLNRQNNIIEYFKSTGNPLNRFMRIDSTIL